MCRLGRRCRVGRRGNMVAAAAFAVFGVMGCSCDLGTAVVVVASVSAAVVVFDGYGECVACGG